MDAFELSGLIAQRQDSNKRYLEFLRVPSMSLGLYVLPPGAVDTQQPHTEDEVYYVASGRAIVRVGNEDRVVEPGGRVVLEPSGLHRVSLASSIPSPPEGIGVNLIFGVVGGICGSERPRV